MGKDSRDTFQSKFGFILSCVGSAVGMANIWLFPYRVAQHGGAAFLIPYFIFVVFIGIAGVAGEMAFGRAMEAGPLGAFRKAAEMRGKEKGKIGELVGFVPTIGSLALAIGYSVVVGWIIKYLLGSFTGSAFTGDSGAYFGALCADFGSWPWHMIGLFIAFAMMVFGISNGIEKINKVMMPLFFCLFLLLAVVVAFLDGSAEGYLYLLKPNWEQLLNPKTWVYALGQAFFSLSLAGSGTVVYGSYLKKSENILTCAKNVALFDTIASSLAALVVIPSVFAFGLDLNSGPGLMFITMPKVFQMMPFGQGVMIIFFVAVFFAAITSLINLFESPVEALQEKFGLSRIKAVLLVAILAVLVGLVIENGDTVSTWMDVISIYIIPLGAILAAIMFFWVCPKGFAREQVQLGSDKPVGKWFEYATRYLFVGLTIIVYILGIIYGGIG